jgi:hypothetical protein
MSKLNVWRVFRAAVMGLGAVVCFQHMSQPGDQMLASAVGGALSAAWILDLIDPTR